ncbi:cilia- and flagella-associated protein [Histomonas meleagridis]|uniref:cilia- and flagella-associated protein 57 n=1 Tax=Histomonas meleagridis TaxID=135588 RepID=UPI003559BE6F|nr:cilia- and flagella-associated protein [Histomonas meleagridis]KAH0801546.1 cilia- and flagella-associated protein 57 [Histomonas meleagridis]
MSGYTGLRLEPVTALGINILDNKTIHWNGSRQFFYPVGIHIQQYQLETNQTQFLFSERFEQNSAETIKICDVCIFGNGQFIAISEVFRPKHGILSIYDTETQMLHTRLRHDKVNEFVSLTFSYEDGMIAAIGKGEEENKVFVWKMGRQVGLAATFQVSKDITSICFDPQNSFRLLLFSKEQILIVLIDTPDRTQTVIDTNDIRNYNCYSFVPSIRNLLLVSSNNTLITILGETVVDMQELISTNIDQIESVRNFVFLISKNVIHCFKASQSYPYLEFIGPLNLQADIINEFSPSPDGDLAIVLYNNSFTYLLDFNIAQKYIRQRNEMKNKNGVSLDSGRIYSFDDFLEIKTKNDNQFLDIYEIEQYIGLLTPLPMCFQMGPITAIAKCPRKPLIATCGKDLTLMIWNLAKKTVLSTVRLSETVNSCSFHPSGDLLAVGKSNSLSLYSLSFNSLILNHKWEPLSCTCVSFSNGGHLLAVGSVMIKVISTYTNKTVASLRGHNLSIKSIAWANNDSFFISAGLDGNIFKWSAKSWERTCEITQPYQFINAILTTPNIHEEETTSNNYNILALTSNSLIYDKENSNGRSPNKKCKLTAMCLPVNFSIVTGDQRGNVQVIPYPLLPFEKDNPFHIGIEVSVHTLPVNYIMHNNGQTLYSTSEDSSIFIFNIIQPHQMVLTAPVSIALSREEQSFLVDKEIFTEKQETILHLREMLNLHRSQFKTSNNKLNEEQNKEIEKYKNKWKMTLSSLKKQLTALSNEKEEQERKATQIIIESENEHNEKMKKVKELYEKKLAEQTQASAELMKEKISIQADYEDKIHKMTEEFKAKLVERKESAKRQLEIQASDNVEAEKEFKQVERLQVEEKITLQHEHELEMENFKQKFEQEINNLNNEIDIVRTDLVNHQDAYDGNIEQISSMKSNIVSITNENKLLEQKKRVLTEKTNQIQNDLLGRNERVTHQTTNLLELKSKNDELQKWRAVMDFRLSELKTQVEPNSQNIENLRKQISDNEILLRQMKQINTKDSQQLEKMENKINDLYNNIIKTENQIQKFESTINIFKNKIRSLYTEVKPENWVTEIEQFYKNFISNIEVEINDNEIEIDDDNNMLKETIDEFDRHKDTLSNKIIKLRVKVEDNVENSGLSFLKQIDKNEELINELAKLRKENRNLKSNLHLAQTEINTLLRQCSHESKSLETKVKTLFKSSNIIQPVPQIQKRTTKTGVPVTVEHFT